MDPFKVPKKMNRNVLKAVSTLQSSRTDFVRLDDITQQVRIQTKKCLPVENLEQVVKESLGNLTKLGILRRRGSEKYGLSCMVFGRVGRAPPGPTTNTTDAAKPRAPLRRARQSARGKRSPGHLDPSQPDTNMLIETPIPGKEMPKPRKRIQKKTKVATPHQGLDQPERVESMELDVPAEVQNEITDPQPLFGTPGWTYPRVFQNLPTLVRDDKEDKMDANEGEGKEGSMSCLFPVRSNFGSAFGSECDVGNPSPVLEEGQWPIVRESPIQGTQEAQNATSRYLTSCLVDIDSTDSRNSSITQDSYHSSASNMNISIAHGENLQSTDGEVQISKSLNIQAEQSSILQNPRRSASEYDFYT
ncbi:uncharacterized protein [Drosophila takahashii]|uniref:uncharacterized protein n=1 Tax=Drosophila takahashii TaxID=29030 RepID=UPI001CF88BC1|nr:uncharacterized protein LOC108059382 [Drosophila takahashii]